MNVASLELCKELYELSEWGKSSFTYHIHDGLSKYFTYADGSNQPYIVGGTEYSLSDDEKNGEHIPAYDLGYLLRRLPATEIKTPLVEGYPYHALGSVNGVGKVYAALGDTPEDAACKLCCELIKQGVLKP